MPLSSFDLAFFDEESQEVHNPHHRLGLDAILTRRRWTLKEKSKMASMSDASVQP